MIACLFAYMGTLALLGILTVHGWDQLQLMLGEEPAPRPTWSTASRSYPAFAVRQRDLHDKSVSYAILRHPESGQLKRGGSTGAGSTADWMTSAGNPQLRGAL